MDGRGLYYFNGIYPDWIENLRHMAQHVNTFS